MYRILTPFFTLALLWSSATTADTLKALDSVYEARGWEAVGRLDMRGGGFCSATLIAPDLVLTAAHCVYDDAGMQRPVDSLIFRAGLRKGQSVASRVVSRIAVPHAFRPATARSMQRIANDVALLEIATPIPSHEINPFRVHEGTLTSETASVVSYGRGREQVQSRQKACNLQRHTQQNLVEIDCDVTFGSSGAPVFTHENGRGRVVSVVSGGNVRDTGESYALGPYLPPLIAELKRQLRNHSATPVAKLRRVGVGQGTTRIKRVQVGRKSTSGAKFSRVGGS